MGTGGGRNPKNNCVGVAKEIIQAAEFACYGSLQKNCHTDCNTGHNPVVVDTTSDQLLLYIMLMMIALFTFFF